MARLSIALGDRRRRTVLSLHPGWIPILVIVAWLGAMWQGPQAYPAQDLQGRWLLGAALALAALVSVALREAMRFAILRRTSATTSESRLLRITLYPYGGAFHLSPSRLSWRRQAALILAGPLSSAVLALFFTVLWLWDGQPFYGWLALLNASLAVFTLAPARPLDGARLLAALSHHNRLARLPVERITFHSGDLLAASLVWLGGLSLLLAQFPPGVLMVAVGFLLQLHDDNAPQALDTQQQSLLNRYSVRDVVQQNSCDGASSVTERRGRRRVDLLGDRPAPLPHEPGRGGSDGSALPLREGPSLRSRVIPITAELGTAWRKLHEQNARLLLVVDDYKIVGVCSRAQLLAYLRSRTPKESES